jgi:hypothetical protein
VCVCVCVCVWVCVCVFGRRVSAPSCGTSLGVASQAQPVAEGRYRRCPAAAWQQRGPPEAPSHAAPVHAGCLVLWCTGVLPRFDPLPPCLCAPRRLRTTWSWPRTSFLSSRPPPRSWTPIPPCTAFRPGTTMGRCAEAAGQLQERLGRGVAVGAGPLSRPTAAAHAPLPASLTQPTTLCLAPHTLLFWTGPRVFLSYLLFSCPSSLPLQDRFVANASQLYRSDFFPGLGWMLNRRVWQSVQDSWCVGRRCPACRIAACRRCSGRGCRTRLSCPETA